MLSHQEAERLLHRYFLGETTLTEEDDLRAYFRAGDVRPDLAKLDPMFGYWEEARQVTAPPARVVPLYRRPLVRWMSAAAAVALLLFTSNNWMSEQPALNNSPVAEVKTKAKTIDWSRYEETNPEEAYQILRSALKKASTEMNRSTRLTISSINELDKVFE